MPRKIAASQLGSSITAMEQHVSGLQIQSALTGK